MGSTNSVQPYCRLAIITMQTMPAANWPHRVLSEAMAGALIVVVLVVTYSSLGDAAVIGPSGLFSLPVNVRGGDRALLQTHFCPGANCAMQQTRGMRSVLLRTNAVPRSPECADLSRRFVCSWWGRFRRCAGGRTFSSRSRRRNQDIRTSGRDRPKWERRVVPSYAVRNSPRR